MEENTEIENHTDMQDDTIIYKWYGVTIYKNNRCRNTSMDDVYKEIRTDLMKVYGRDNLIKDIVFPKRLEYIQVNSDSKTNLFRNYILICIDSQFKDEIKEIMRQYLVIKTFSYKREETVNKIRNQFKVVEDTKRQHIYQIGEEVMIIKGVFKQQRCIVKEVHDDGKVTLSVSIFGQDTPITFDVSFIERY